MPVNEKLEARVRDLLHEQKQVAEKRMFGGVAFMVRGNMAVGIVGDDLMVRVGPDQYDDLVGAPHARPMDFTGRPMKGFVFVSPAGTKTRAQLERWVKRGVGYATRLKAKA